MKKVSRISLHNLSKAELANNEMNQLRGGSGIGCAAACIGGACRCFEGESGTFETSAGVIESNIDKDIDRKEAGEALKQMNGTVGSGLS